MKKSFRDLYIWNASVDLAATVSSIADVLVERRRFALADQMQRSAISISSNIAEGQGRLTSRDWRHFLGIARGSLYELETQIEIAMRPKLLTGAVIGELRSQTAKIGCGITRLISTLE